MLKISHGKNKETRAHTERDTGGRGKKKTGTLSREKSKHSARCDGVKESRGVGGKKRCGWGIGKGGKQSVKRKG